MSSLLKPEPPVLAQKYRLIGQLDAGGMASVWVAEALHLSSLVAVKIMDGALTSTPEAAQRFLREARTAASLRSPHVVQILDYGVHEGTPFIVMELLEGESLASRLARDGRLASWEQTELVLRHVARALRRTHDAGVIHRDLKPANIFLVRDEEELLVKLLDFGIAKATAQLSAALASNTRTGEFLGSPAYASPEQLQGSKDLDHRADIWSLGVIAYECLLGRQPFDSDSFVGLLLAICTGPLPVPSEQGPVPAGFDAWFARACARDVERRFQSVREASAELRALFEAACGSRPALLGPGTSSLTAGERVPVARLDSAPAPAARPERPPSRTAMGLQLPPPELPPPELPPPELPPPALPPPELPPPALTAGPTPELPVVRTDTVRLIGPQPRLGQRRRATVLWAALALSALLALVFFSVDASTSRAALDSERGALGAGPPSEPTRHAAPAPGGELTPLGPRQSSDEPSAPSAVVEPGPTTNPTAAADPNAAVDPNAAPSTVPPDRASQASDPAANPSAPRRSASPRSPRGLHSSEARLTITASEPAEVLLDGSPLGNAPLQGISVEPGRHEVTFVHDGKRTVEALTIRSGEHKRVEARLAPPRLAPPRIEARPAPPRVEARPAPPRVETRIASPSGDGLDEASVKRTIKRNRSAVIESCWEHAFGTRAPGDPTSIRVPVTITVAPSGVVQSVVTEAEPSGYPELRHCIEKRVSAWTFPSARADTVVSVAFVFALS